MIAFVIGFVAALFSDDTRGTPLLVGAMTGGMAFVGSLILLARDRSRNTATLKLVRDMLLARDDVHENDFCRSFSEMDAKLLVDMRNAISNFFGVPATKIHPDDELQENFRFETFQPFFLLHVVGYIVNQRNLKCDSFFAFRTGKLKNIADLAIQVRNVLNDLEARFPGKGCNGESIGRTYEGLDGAVTDGERFRSRESERGNFG
jgi:hypothetical protein